MADTPSNEQVGEASLIHMLLLDLGKKADLGLHFL